LELFDESHRCSYCAGVVLQRTIDRSLFGADLLDVDLSCIDVALKSFLCSRNAGHLSLDRFGVRLERLATRDPPGDRLGCFGAGLFDILAELIQMIMDVPVIF
jgi:hypothetical protein